MRLYERSEVKPEMRAPALGNVVHVSASGLRYPRALCVVCLLACACFPGVVDVSAQEVVHLPAGDRLLDADFEEVYRVGSLAGEDWEQFGNVRKVAFDEAGHLYVFDDQTDRIVVVGPDGEHMRGFGRRGEGPGEFRNAVAVAVMRDGWVVVADTGHRAYQVFDANGVFERMVRMTAEGVLIVTDLLPNPRGGSVFSAVGGRTLSFSWSRDSGSGDVAPHTSRPIERVQLTGDVVERDTVAEGWLPPYGEPLTVDLGGAQMRFPIAPPRVFGPSMLPGVLPDGDVVFSDSTAYVIKLARPGTGVWRTLERPIRPIPVTDRVIEAEKRRRLSVLAATPDQELPQNSFLPRSPEEIRRRERERIANLEFFEEVSVVRDLQTTWHGRIWVQRRGEEPGDDDGPIDVLTADGRYLGSLAARATEMPSAFGPGGLAAFVEEDEFDVKVVIVKRLPEQLN